MRRLGLALSAAALLAGCGGGGGNGGGGGSVATPAPTPVATPTPTQVAGCSLRERQDWAAGQLREWYLFPETLPAALDPAPFANVSDYVDALTATARGQRRDRNFTYVTSIAEENAYYASGETAGFGWRLTLDGSGTRVLVAESFEGTPALAANIDRGAELLAIGTSRDTLLTIDQIARTSGNLGEALGPDTPGTTRFFRIRDAAGERVVQLAKRDFELQPVSSRYGARIIEDGGRRVGYLNLRTFISTADPALRAAFANFRSNGITQLIVDLRYNGGGLVSVAELMGDLMGANRSTADVFSYTSFRSEKSANDRTRLFAPLPESIAPTRVAFIGTGGSASASELVINSFVPYLGTGAALVGTNTYGKPVGQIARDRPECDDRLRVVAFATQNSQRQGAYYSGLAGFVGATCQAGDDLSQPLGDPREASVRQALNFLAGQSCTPITAAAVAGLSRAPTASATPGRMLLLSPNRPNTAQREVPGLF